MPSGGLGICADINDGAIAVQLCLGGQEDCNETPDSVCVNTGTDFCLTPSLMCPDLS